VVGLAWGWRRGALGPVPARAGGGREGRPAAPVWFHGWGRAGAPVVGLPARPVAGLVVARVVGSRARRVGHSWAVHSITSRSAGLAGPSGVPPLAQRPIRPQILRDHGKSAGRCLLGRGNCRFRHCAGNNALSIIGLVNSGTTRVRADAELVWTDLGAWLTA
jgi:molybdopterin biosynthesis enzyme